MSRRALTSVIAALLLATTPAAAFADGAGDEQYQDPFSAPSAPKQTKKKAATAPATTAPATTAAPAATTAPTSTSSPATAVAQAVPAATAAPTLPRTGAPADAIALAGVALIASGAVLRRRTTTH
jgi:LPXTG-motif cell wall-anchored protein